MCSFPAVLCGHWRIQRDQLWEMPLALERDKMSFLLVVPEGQHGIRGKMHDIKEELPLAVLEGEA